MSGQDVAEELKLIVNILDTLSTSQGVVRRDQVIPLMSRLSAASEKLWSVPEPLARGKDVSKTGSLSHTFGNLDNNSFSSRSIRAAALPVAVPTPKNRQVVTKPSSIKVRPIPRETPPSDSVKISSEVAHCITSSLYNILEGTTALVRASSSSIFVRQGDEVVSIVNVSKKLSFPPQLVRHRAVGSPDAEVLGSGIALNQRAADGGPACASILIFPIYSMSNLHEVKGRPIATLHVENKLQGMAPFDEMDECICYFASCLMGELMSRVPQMDWLNNFYDPITQHIVSPFKAAAILTLPSVYKTPEPEGIRDRKERKTKFKVPIETTLSTRNVKDTSSPISSSVIEDIENCVTKMLIKRESLADSGRQPSCGLIQLPTLREVKSFLENIEECWKESVTTSIGLTESDRELQLEVRQLRAGLIEANRKYNDAAERLRLYELDIDDYKREYKDMKTEFEVYLRKQENLDI